MKKMLLATILLLLILLPLAGVVAAEEGVKVDYNPKTDVISITASKQLLSDILKVVAMKSGADIRMDPAADKNVSLKVIGQKLDVALESIGRQKNLNYGLIFHGNADESRERPGALVSMRIYAPGSYDDSALKSLVSPVQAIKKWGTGESSESGAAPMESGANVARERWMNRLDMMSPEERDKVEKTQKRLAEKSADRAERRQERLEEKRANREAKRLEHEAELEALRLENPEAYELRMQRKAERSQEYRESLKGQYYEE